MTPFIFQCQYDFSKHLKRVLTVFLYVDFQVKQICNNSFKTYCDNFLFGRGLSTIKVCDFLGELYSILLDVIKLVIDMLFPTPIIYQLGVFELYCQEPKMFKVVPDLCNQCIILVKKTN